MRSLLILFLVILVSAQAFAGRIQISSKVYVSGPKIGLADLGDFGDLGSENQKLIREISLGDAPSFAETRVFSSSAVAEIIRRQVPSKVLGGHQLVIPADVQVIGKGVLVDVPGVRAALIEKIQSNCDGCDILVDDLQVKETNCPPQSRWTFSNEVARVRGSFSVPIRIDAPTKPSETSWVQGRVRILKRVPVANRTIPLGSPVTEADFLLASRDITFIQDGFPSAAELLNAKAGATVGVGQIITRGVLLRERAVTSGEVVTVSMGSDRWKVSLKAVAQQGGFVGDSIRMTNPDTKKSISGVIVAKGQVETK